jgi:MFS family permease
MPVVLLVFAGFLCAYGWRVLDPKFRRLFLRVTIALCVALLPYLKNIALYHNPTWPGGIPALKSYIPALSDTGDMHDTQTPPPLRGMSQSGVFFHSLFEIDHPTSYPDRERWIIDQGNAWIAYRSGGFWAVAVVTAAAAAVLLGFLSKKRNGIVVVAVIATLWGMISVLPQSHELRYFLFLPLTLAACIGMLIPTVRTSYPATTLAILSVILCQFVWIGKVNRTYYRVERIGYRRTAEIWGANTYWDKMQPGKTYCAVGFEPIGIMLTGPTMHEFHIIDRNEEGLCPPGMTVLRK